jgi:ADP-dependent NAD(P)H-hydrate dehydratase / NAD(P)H-hydrate epimerase
MEAAGRALAETTERVAGEGPVRVVCGKGNNGGDGLVAARHLAEAGHEVDILLIWAASELSPDATANLERFGGEAQEIEAGGWADALAGSGAIVDAIFGTGFSGAPRAPADTAIEEINECSAPVIAADIASGVDASTGEVAGAAVEATNTVGFHSAKIGHWVSPGKKCTGELEVTEIGIPGDAPAEPPAGLIHPSVLELTPLRGSESTKFSSGQVLIIGGSRGLTGAVCMSAAAATRAGAGYATVAVPAELEPIFEIKLTEVMSVGCPSADGQLTMAAVEPIAAAAERAAAVVLGPGLGRSEITGELVAAIAAAIDAPLVIDADALTAIAGDLEVLAPRSAPTVLTPHAGELGRLLGIDSAEVGVHRLASAMEAAARAGAVVVLKGDDTIVAAPGERPAVNGLASPALATAGTGDVLSGMVAALIARGLEARVAAAAGVHAHTRAGRAAARTVGMVESVIATDVIEAIAAGLRPGSEV